MPARAHERFKKSYRRTLDTALVLSLAAHLLAFASFPPGRPAVPAEPPVDPIEIVDVESFRVPSSPPPPPSRPEVLTIDETFDVAQEMAESTYDPEADVSLPAPPARSSGFVVYQEAPRVRRAVPPEYPSTARAAGMEGTVRLLVTVDERGRVVAAEVLASDARVFDGAALEAVREWSFSPALQSGRPVRATVVVPVRFSLR